MLRAAGFMVVCQGLAVIDTMTNNEQLKSMGTSLHLLWMAILSGIL